MKRILSLLLTVVLLGLLVGCGSANKPESTVIKFCDALKAFDMETASSCFESNDANIENPYTEENEENQDIFSEQAIEYLKECAKEMTYTMGEAEIDGNTAVIPVTFTYVDAGPVISEAMGEYISQAFALAFSGATDSEMEDLFGTIFMEKTKSVSVGNATSKVEFNCNKSGDEWKIQELNDETQYEISNIISCNIAKTMESLDDGLNNESSDDSESSEYSNDSETVEEYVWYDIPAGQVLELATIKIAITGCEEVDKLVAEYFEPDVAQEGTKFVVLTVEVENITKSTLNFNNDFMLYDDQGREYKPYSNALWYFEEAFMYTELAPNIKATGNFVYQVPADAQGYYLTVAKSGTNEAYSLYAQ